MRFKSLHKVHDGAYLHRYDAVYETATGREKRYELVSRQSELTTQQQLCCHAPDAVILLLCDASGEHLLVQREFRMAAGCFVYNFPAGLIDAGESVEQAARRELREETGLTLLRVDHILPPSFNAVGFSNESNVCLLGAAGGSFAPSSSDEEEISAAWYSPGQLRQLIAAGAPFEGRTQAFCWQWAVARQ